MADDLSRQFAGLDRVQAEQVLEQLEGVLTGLAPDGGSAVDRGTRERLEGFVSGVRVGLGIR